MSKILLDYSLADLQRIVIELGESKFRAKQIQQALLKGKELDDISNISKDLKSKLKNKGYVGIGVKILEKINSKDSSTTKYLFLLHDKNIIEGVLMRYSYGNTICISTQVGCRMNCGFCASGMNGFVRNLTTAEILAQVLLVNNDLKNDAASEEKEREIKNIVLMGSGEPLDNFENVVGFLKMVNSKESLNVGQRNISLSTCGIVDKIYDLSTLDFNLTLTISLHAANDYVRSQIMPIAKKYKIGELIEAAKHYFKVTGRRVIFEYAIIKGVNDKKQDALDLVDLLKGFPCHVNIIKLNYVEEKEFRSATAEKTNDFLEILKNGGISATLRREMGSDIAGACGQLRRRYIDAKNGKID